MHKAKIWTKIFQKEKSPTWINGTQAMNLNQKAKRLKTVMYRGGCGGSSVLKRKETPNGAWDRWLKRWRGACSDFRRQPLKRVDSLLEIGKREEEYAPSICIEENDLISQSKWRYLCTLVCSIIHGGPPPSSIYTPKEEKNHILETEDLWAHGEMRIKWTPSFWLSKADAFR